MVSDGPLVGSKLDLKHGEVVIWLRFRRTPCGVEAINPHAVARPDDAFQTDPLWGRSLELEPTPKLLDGFRRTPCGVEATLQIYR